MTDDIVTRLRGKEHGDNDRRCKSCDSFCCHCELCDCCLEILEVCLEAADEIERLQEQLGRMTEVAQLWNGAYSAQTYIHGLDDIETADMARQAQAKAVRNG